MTDTTALFPLNDVLTLTPGPDGTLQSVLHEDFSNAMISRPPTDGFPFGGLLAALAARAMRQGLGLSVPLRTLSVQYLAAATYGEPLTYRPRLLRGGRTVTYTGLDILQGERMTHHASATWGADQPGLILQDANVVPPPLDSLDPARTLGGPMAPRFSRYVEYRFETGPNILGGNEGKPAVERVWMRVRDAGPLTEETLCYLLDTLYPPSWTAFRKPPPMTTIDLRYDLLETLTPETAPDGWLFFEFRTLTLENGWTVDDAIAWTADGRAIATSRQRRKLLFSRPTRSSE